MGEQAWSVFSIEELTRSVAGEGAQFVEFLRSPALTCAVYRVPAGAQDMQAPHLEDEVYFVISGRATLRIGDQVHNVKAGNILYVQATIEHSFFRIEEDLVLIAIFGPPLLRAP